MSAGSPSAIEEDRDPGQQRQDRHRGDDRGVAEDPVAAAAAPSGRRRQELTGIGRGVDLGHGDRQPASIASTAGIDLFGQRRRRAAPSRRFRRPASCPSGLIAYSK